MIRLKGIALTTLIVIMGIACVVGLGLGGKAAPDVSSTNARRNSNAATPSSDRVPYDPKLADNTVAFWEKQASRDDQGALERNELSRAYLARQRETGDIADAVRAEATARDSLGIRRRNNAAALTSLGRSLLVQHRFPEALEAAKAAAAYENSASRLVADIQIELGQYDEALALLKSTAQETDDLNYFALRARLDGIEGNAEGAIRFLNEARKIVQNRVDLPAEAAAWYSTMLGHLQTEAGDLDHAEQSCHEALKVFPRDYRAMTGLATVAAWRGQWREVITWGDRALGVCPQNPEAIRLVGDAHGALGNDPEAKRLYDQLEKLFHSFPRIYDRHWILFCADKDRDLDQALELARKDLDLRKDVHAYDTLAWVCYKKGLQKEAEAAMQKALARGTREATLLSHAGMIARAGGDAEKAKDYFKKARAVNPRSVPLRWVQWMESTP